MAEFFVHKNELVITGEVKNSDREALKTLLLSLEAEHSTIRVVLEECTHLHSAGLSELIDSHKRCAVSLRKELILVNSSPAVNRILNMTHLHSLFNHARRKSEDL